MWQSPRGVPQRFLLEGPDVERIGVVVHGGERKFPIVGGQGDADGPSGAPLNSKGSDPFLKPGLIQAAPFCPPPTFAPPGMGVLPPPLGSVLLLGILSRGTRPLRHPPGYNSKLR